MELAARRPAIGPVVTSDLLFEVVQVQQLCHCQGGCFACDTEYQDSLVLAQLQELGRVRKCIVGGNAWSLQGT